MRLRDGQRRNVLVQGMWKDYAFASPPRLPAVRLTVLSLGSTFAGWRDGRIAVDDEAGEGLPEHVGRRVEEPTLDERTPLPQLLQRSARGLQVC